MSGQAGGKVELVASGPGINAAGRVSLPGGIMSAIAKEILTLVLFVIAVPLLIWAVLLAPTGNFLVVPLFSVCVVVMIVAVCLVVYTKRQHYHVEQRDAEWSWKLQSGQISSETDHSEAAPASDSAPPVAMRVPPSSKPLKMMEG